MVEVEGTSHALLFGIETTGILLRNKVSIWRKSIEVNICLAEIRRSPEIPVL